MRGNVLIYAPTEPADAISGILAASDVFVEKFQDAEPVRAQLRNGADAIIVALELVSEISDELASKSTDADGPPTPAVIVLISHLPEQPLETAVQRLRDPIFLERTASPVTVVSTVNAALRLHSQDCIRRKNSAHSTAPASLNGDPKVQKSAERKLQHANEELEMRVVERTAELSETVEVLTDEVHRRTLAEEALRQRGEQLLSLASDERKLQHAKEELEMRVVERTAELSETVEVLTDEVHRRALAEEALRQRGEQLRALASELTLSEQRERSHLAELLHDTLQQLLVCAKFRVEMLSQTSAPDLKTVERELRDLLDQSIDFSRSLTAELSPPVLHKGGLAAALEWLTVWMQEKHDLRIELSTDETAVAESEEVKILLFQSVRELLFNIVKHAHVKRASVFMNRQGDDIEIVVADHGVGFDPDTAIRQPGKAEGFGLFSIMERLELLGGRMDIDSSPAGSRFRLVSPCKAKSPLRLGEPSTLAGIKSKAPPVINSGCISCSDNPPIRVLLVDDHSMLRECLIHFLREEPDIGVVGEASDGPSAIEMVGRLRPDVVIMDIILSGEMTGIEATRRICAEFPDVCVIGLSMFDDAHQANALREAGALYYLRKSSACDVLVSAIRACTDKQPV